MITIELTIMSYLPYIVVLFISWSQMTKGYIKRLNR